MKKPNIITIRFPEKALSLNDIYEQSGNKTSKDTPIFYSHWWKDEKFASKEKTRQGNYSFGTMLLDETRNKTWHEQEAILKEKGCERMNAAEIAYILWQHEKATGERLLDGWNFYWTSSRSSRGLLVSVGYFDGGGVRVGGDDPRDRFDGLARFVLPQCGSG